MPHRPAPLKSTPPPIHSVANPIPLHPPERNNSVPVDWRKYTSGSGFRPFNPHTIHQIGRNGSSSSSVPGSAFQPHRRPHPYNSIKCSPTPVLHHTNAINSNLPHRHYSVSPGSNTSLGLVITGSSLSSRHIQSQHVVTSSHATTNLVVCNMLVVLLFQVITVLAFYYILAFISDIALYTALVRLNGTILFP